MVGYSMLGKNMVQLERKQHGGRRGAGMCVHKSTAVTCKRQTGAYMMSLSLLTELASHTEYPIEAVTKRLAACEMRERSAMVAAITEEVLQFARDTGVHAGAKEKQKRFVRA